VRSGRWPLGYERDEENDVHPYRDPLEGEYAPHLAVTSDELDLIATMQSAAEGSGDALAEPDEVGRQLDTGFSRQAVIAQCLR